MKKPSYFLFLFFLITSCKPGIPKDIIQPAQMALVLHDIHLVDGYLMRVPTDSIKMIGAAYYKGIYKKFGVDSVLYAKSMDYYFLNPKALDGIYDQVTKELNREKAILVKADSLKDAKRLKTTRLKMKADSAKRGAILRKFKADSIKKADSVKKAGLKVSLKFKKLDSIRKARLLKKLKKKAVKKTVVVSKTKI